MLENSRAHSRLLLVKTPKPSNNQTFSKGLWSKKSSQERAKSKKMKMPQKSN
jgi:hypothetical protein